MPRFRRSPKEGKPAKKGLIYRMVMGSEKDEDYARAQLPSNRWALGWDLFKSRFGKMILINLIVLIGFLGVFFFLIWNNSMKAVIGATLPFLGNIGVGYPSAVNVLEHAHYLNMQAEIKALALGLISFLILAPPFLAGAFYTMRNIVWTEGIFVANDFWKGFKKNYWRFLLISFIFSVIFFIAVYNIITLHYQINVGISNFWTILFLILAYFSIVVLIMFTLFMYTLNVTYELKFIHLMKNAFLLTVGLFPQSIFFMAIGFLPITLLLFVPGMFTISSLIVIFFGLSLPILIWTNYSQWAFDKFLNDKVEGAVKNRGIYPKFEKKDEDVIEERKYASLASYYAKERRAVKPVNDTDITITELPMMFSRDDLEKLRQEKELVKEDADRYAEEAKKNGNKNQGYKNAKRANRKAELEKQQIKEENLSTDMVEEKENIEEE